MNEDAYTTKVPLWAHTVIFFRLRGLMWILVR